MRSRLCRAFVAVACCAALSPSASAETWLDSAGKFRVEATFLRLKDDTVHLKRLGGTEIKLPLAKLSADDQERARKLAERAEAFDIPPAPPAAVSVDPSVRILVTDPSNSRPLFAQGAPLVHVHAVYDFTNGRRIGEAVSARDDLPESSQALSSSGRCCAYAYDNPDGSTELTVSVGSRPPTHTFRVENKDLKTTVWLGFLSDRELCWLGAAASGGSVGRVFDLEKNAQVREFALPDHLQRAALHPNKRSLALSCKEQLVLYDLETSRPIRGWGTPAAATDLAFSPDGSEIAMAHERGLLAFDLYGRATYAFRPQSRRDGLIKWTDIQWVGTAGWLVNGKSLFDRRRGMMVAVFDGPDYIKNYLQAIDQNTVLGVVAVNEEEDPNRSSLETEHCLPVAIPWASIERVVAVYQGVSQEKSLIRPGVKVKIEVNLGPLMGDGGEVRDKIVQQYTKLLEENGLVAADDGEMRLVVDYSEKAGMQFEVYEKTGFDIDVARGLKERKPIGSGTQTELTSHSRLLAANGKEVWSDEQSMGSFRTGEARADELDTAGLRRSKVQFFVEYLMTLSLPVVLLEDGTTLPVKIVSDAAAR